MGLFHYNLMWLFDSDALGFYNGDTQGLFHSNKLGFIDGDTLGQFDRDILRPLTWHLLALLDGGFDVDVVIVFGGDFDESLDGDLIGLIDEKF